MAAPYRGASAPLDARDAWIPVASLPPPLRERLAAMGPGEPCESAAMRGSKPPYGLLVLAGAVCLVALLSLLSSPPSPPFARATRWLPLVAGGVAAAATATVLAMRRRGWWAPSAFHLGPTTLLTVEAGHLRVMPAERVDATPERIGFDGDVLDEGVHDPAWLAELASRSALARADAGARDADPWRSLAAMAPRVTRSAALGARALRVAAGVLAGAALGAFVEAVPLGVPGARSEREARSRREAEAARRAAREREAARAADARAREARERRERLRASALTGAEEDARAWLRQVTLFDDEAFNRRVEARLAGFCAERYPEGSRVPPSLLAYFVLLQRACADPDRRLFYQSDQRYATLGARAISRGLQRLSDLLGRPMEVHPFAVTEPDGQHPYAVIAVTGYDRARDPDPPPARELETADGPGETRTPMLLELLLFDKNGERLAVPTHVERVTLVERVVREHP